MVNLNKRQLGTRDLPYKTHKLFYNLGTKNISMPS